MSTRYLDIRSTAQPTRTNSKAAGVRVDSVTPYELKYLANGTEKTVVTTDGTQILTNKTITGASSSGGTATGQTLVTPAGVVVAQEALFTQVTGNKTHTATFTIPAGATILNVIVTNSVVWNSGTSATLKVGLVDDDCFFTGARLDSGVLAAGTAIDFTWTGAYGGASIPAIDGGGANDVLGATNGFLYNATAQSLTAIVTDVNVSGTNGRTRVTVLYSLPPSVISPVVA